MSPTDEFVERWLDVAALYAGRARAHGVAMDDASLLALLAMDIELNAQGLGVWLDRGR